MADSTDKELQHYLEKVLKVLERKTGKSYQHIETEELRNNLMRLEGASMLEELFDVIRIEESTAFDSQNLELILKKLIAFWPQLTEQTPLALQAWEKLGTFLIATILNAPTARGKVETLFQAKEDSADFSGFKELWKKNKKEETTVLASLVESFEDWQSRSSGEAPALLKEWVEGRKIDWAVRSELIEDLARAIKKQGKKTYQQHILNVLRKAWSTGADINLDVSMSYIKALESLYEVQVLEEDALQALRIVLRSSRENGLVFTNQLQYSRALGVPAALARQEALATSVKIQQQIVRALGAAMRAGIRWSDIDNLLKEAAGVFFLSSEPCPLKTDEAMKTQLTEAQEIADSLLATLLEGLKAGAPQSLVLSMSKTAWSLSRNEKDNSKTQNCFFRILGKLLSNTNTFEREETDSMSALTTLEIAWEEIKSQELEQETYKCLLEALENGLMTGAPWSRVGPLVENIWFRLTGIDDKDSEIQAVAAEDAEDVVCSIMVKIMKLALLEGEGESENFLHKLLSIWKNKHSKDPATCHDTLAVLKEILTNRAWCQNIEYVWKVAWNTLCDHKILTRKSIIQGVLEGLDQNSKLWKPVEEILKEALASRDLGDERTSFVVEKKLVEELIQHLKSISPSLMVGRNAEEDWEKAVTNDLKDALCTFGSLLQSLEQGELLSFVQGATATNKGKSPAKTVLSSYLGNLTLKLTSEDPNYHALNQAQEVWKNYEGVALAAHEDFVLATAQASEKGAPWSFVEETLRASWAANSLFERLTRNSLLRAMQGLLALNKLDFSFSRLATTFVLRCYVDFTTRTQFYALALADLRRHHILVIYLYKAFILYSTYKHLASSTQALKKLSAKSSNQEIRELAFELGMTITALRHITFKISFDFINCAIMAAFCAFPALTSCRYLL